MLIELILRFKMLCKLERPVQEGVLLVLEGDLSLYR